MDNSAIRVSFLTQDSGLGEAIARALGEGFVTHAVREQRFDQLGQVRQESDVILLDLGLPEMDGVHVARFFREDEQLKDKVLIAITGYADEMHRSQCEAVGFDCILAKPAAWEDLKSTIDRLWSKRKMP